jgi:acyl CoA:acetate/3-ketoacid CoA transferase alpha subunit
VTFDPTAGGASVGMTGGSPIVNGVLRQPDGKRVLIGGFRTVNGQPHHLIARLHADGNVDDTFNSRHAGDGNWGLASVAAHHGGSL